MSKNLGERIKSIRLELGLTMEEFGQLFQTSKGTVNNWEKGRNNPNKENLKEIANLKNITVNELLYGSIEERVQSAISSFLKENNFDFSESDFDLQQIREIKNNICQSLIGRTEIEDEEISILVNGSFILHLANKNSVKLNNPINRNIYTKDSLVQGAIQSNIELKTRFEALNKQFDNNNSETIKKIISITDDAIIKLKELNKKNNM